MSCLKLQQMKLMTPNARAIFGTNFDVYEKKIYIIVTMLRLLNDLKWETVLCFLFKAVFV
jgi:hypothetical protein